MNALKNQNKETLFAFDHGFWGFNNKHPLGIAYQAAFDIEQNEQLILQANIIKDGLNLFEKIFGYRAVYFVPPNGPFNNTLEEFASLEGIRFMSTSKIQHEPLGQGKNRKVFHYLGQINRYGQYYITRNCFFEPSDHCKDWVDCCMNEINIAFKWKKPAVISSHRVNYIGVLNTLNRDYGLLQLRRLLEQILKIWPEVEFMTSDELGKLLLVNDRSENS